MEMNWRPKKNQGYVVGIDFEISLKKIEKIKTN